MRRDLDLREKVIRLLVASLLKSDLEFVEIEQIGEELQSNEDFALELGEAISSTAQGMVTKPPRRMKQPQLEAEQIGDRHNYSEEYWEAEILSSIKRAGLTKAQVTRRCRGLLPRGTKWPVKRSWTMKKIVSSFLAFVTPEKVFSLLQSLNGDTGQDPYLEKMFAQRQDD